MAAKGTIQEENDTKGSTAGTHRDPDETTVARRRSAVYGVTYKPDPQV